MCANKKFTKIQTNYEKNKIECLNFPKFESANSINICVSTIIGIMCVGINMCRYYCVSVLMYVGINVRQY